MITGALIATVSGIAIERIRNRQARTTRWDETRRKAYRDFLVLSITVADESRKVFLGSPSLKWDACVESRRLLGEARAEISLLASKSINDAADILMRAIKPLYEAAFAVQNSNLTDKHRAVLAPAELDVETTYVSIQGCQETFVRVAKAELLK